jgi:hypothetical protein
MIRLNFTSAVERQIVFRNTDMKGNIWCEGCHALCLSRADYEIDHTVAEGARIAPDGDRPKLTADDGKLLCLKCHDRKTRRDVFEISKTKRLEKKHRVVGKGQSEIARRYGITQEDK